MVTAGTIVSCKEAGKVRKCVNVNEGDYRLLRKAGRFVNDEDREYFLVRKDEDIRVGK